MIRLNNRIPVRTHYSSSSSTSESKVSLNYKLNCLNSLLPRTTKTDSNILIKHQHNSTAILQILALSVLSLILLSSPATNIIMFTSAYKHSSSRTRMNKLPALLFVHNHKHQHNRMNALHKNFGRNNYNNHHYVSPFTTIQSSFGNNNDVNNENEKSTKPAFYSHLPDHFLEAVEKLIDDDDDEQVTQHVDAVAAVAVAAPSPQNTVEIKSKQVPGGNWDPNHPLQWTEQFGRRNSTKDEELYQMAQLRPGDEGYFDVSGITVPGVTIVRTKEEAKIVMERLMSKESENAIHACDTEVMAIDLKEVGPVGNGYVTCASIYSGPDFDYGLGDGPGTALWIDNIDDSFGVLQCFKEFFEDERFLTVWHNYGFDRHVMWNEGIDVRGFKGDTMHMARLEDTSRAKYGAGMGYSLEALTSDILKRRKKPMKEIFGVARLRKDGSEGSLIDVPPVEVLQRDPRFRKQWIIYSAYDAEGTWLLREELQKKLEKLDWVRSPCV